MPWIAPNVGYVDNRGCLRCSDCADESHRQFPVAGDTSRDDDDICCACGLRLEHITSKDYVRVPYDCRAVPDLVRSL